MEMRNNESNLWFYNLTLTYLLILKSGYAEVAYSTAYTGFINIFYMLLEKLTLLKNIATGKNSRSVQLQNIWHLPDHIHWSSTRLEEVSGVFNLTHIRENALPHRLWGHVIKNQHGTVFGSHKHTLPHDAVTLICSAKVFSSSVSSTAALLPERKYCAAAIILPSNCRFFTSSCREREQVLSAKCTVNIVKESYSICVCEGWSIQLHNASEKCLITIFLHLNTTA